MQTTDDRVRDVLGRMADEAPPPVAFSDLAQPTVAASTAVGRRHGLRLAAGVLVLVLLGGLAVWWRARPTEPVAATVEELEQALDDGFAALFAGGGVRGTQEASVQGHTGVRVWFAAAADGDRATVQRSDVDVIYTAWWLTSPTPPREGENIVTNAWVVVGGTGYEAGPESEGRWRLSTLDSDSVLAFGLGVLYPDSLARQQLTPPTATVTRQAAGGGRTVWVVVYPEGGSARFVVGGGGEVVSWSVERTTGAALDGPPYDSVTVTYEPLDEPPRLAAPQPDIPLDLSAFDFVGDLGEGG